MTTQPVTGIPLCEFMPRVCSTPAVEQSATTPLLVAENYAMGGAPVSPR